MDPLWTFFYGLTLLILLGSYFITESGTRKRMIGTVLTVLTIAFCLYDIIPPFDVKDASGRVITPGKIHLGLDLQGGTSFLIRLDPPMNDNGTQKKITPDMVDQAVEAIRKRVDQFGTGEPTITPQGTDRILVQIPGITQNKIADAREQLKKVAKLEFYEVDPESAAKIAAAEAGHGIIPPDERIGLAEEKSGQKTAPEKLLIKKRPVLTGDRVTNAAPTFDQRGWGVSLQLDSQGAKLFDDFAATHVGQRFAIVLDGKIMSAPQLNEGHYGGLASITGHFTEQEARSLASVLVNPLQTPVIIDEERQASATLGADSIKSGIYAGVVGLILVAVFMIVYYRLVGFIAIVALIVNCVMVVGLLAMFNSVLTLPGIAGLILSLGIAIDANVLIYERLREELDHGKSLQPAVDASYSKAFSAIFDAHVTQFLTAAILFWLANGPVKGFALTLTIGIVASMFSSLLITYTCFSWVFALKALNRITMLHLIRSKAFDFVGNAGKFIIVSGTLVALSIGILVVRGERNLGADFRGGDLLVLSAKQALTPDQVRDALAGTGYAGATIQAEHMTDHDLISIRSDYGTAEKIKDRLSQALPAAGLNFEKTDHVGPMVGRELADKSAVALFLGLAGIFIYVSMRFETSFAVGSVVALAHDLLITLGIFVLSGRELSLIMVGAILSIAGYSINDKIVVFDRIRSGLRDHHGGDTEAEIVNTSINETLSRTILTGGTALLTVLALYFFGGPVLNDFAFSFVIGIAVGTYSSIFIASPIVLFLSGRKGRNLRSEMRKTPSMPARA